MMKRVFGAMPALALAAASVVIGTGGALADDCANLAASIQKLEAGGDARDEQLIRQLHVIHYKTCVLDPAVPAPRQSWYTTDGRRLPTPADGSRPADAAYMTGDDTARKCQGNPAPSICALMIDAEKGRLARAARKAAPLPPSLPGGGLSAMSSPACTARLKRLAASAASNDQAAMAATYAALARDCADVLEAAAREAKVELPTRVLGSRSRSAFGDAIRGGPGSGSGGASGEWDLAEVLRFGLGIAQLASQLKSMQAATANVPGQGARMAPADCKRLLDFINNCRQSQANMGLPGQTGTGTTGQAGAFNDCANTYQAAYRAACR